MNDGFSAKTKKIIFQTAKEELEKMRDSARGQVFDKAATNGQFQTSPVVEAMQQRSSEDTLSDEASKIKHDAQVVRRLRELEEEITRMRMQKRQQEQKWYEGQQGLMGQSQQQRQESSPVVPASGKPKRGSAFARGGKAKASQPKSFETGKSKH